MTAAEPKRGLVVKPVEVGGKLLPPDTYVWILGSEGGHTHVEYRDRVATVPGDAVVPSPIPRPTLAQLRALDPCFGLPPSSFDETTDDDGRYFRLLRCKAHGRYFLEDMRGGAGMYVTLTLLEPGEEDDASATYERYHAMSYDWLSLDGRTL